MRVAALVLGAGRGERLGQAAPKAFVTLAGRPLIAWSLETLAASAAIDLVVPVVPAALCADFERRLGVDLVAPADRAKLAPPVAGGAERVDSLRAGLSALPADVRWVAVHDAARPLLRPGDLECVLARARETGAALLAVPVTDTVKRVRDGLVQETPARDECWAAQTPQVFRRDWLAEGLAKAAATGRRTTDCAQLVEALGIPVHVVAGDPDNLKITHAADLALAETRLASRGASR